MRAAVVILLCLVAFSGCGKKEKTDIIADLESKPIVTEVAPEEKKAEEPTVVDNSFNPATADSESSQQQTPPMPAIPSSVDSTATPPSDPSASATAPAAGGQTYEVSAQKVDPSAPVPQAPPPAPQAPYPPYQGQQGVPQYQNPYGAPPPNPYYGYAPQQPPKKYVPPGPIESAGEFIGHLVNPFKRKEDESKKTYKGI